MTATQDSYRTSGALPQYIAAPNRGTVAMRAALLWLLDRYPRRVAKGLQDHAVPLGRFDQAGEPVGFGVSFDFEPQRDVGQPGDGNVLQDAAGRCPVE